MKLFVYGSDYYLAKEYISSKTNEEEDVRYNSSLSEAKNALEQLSQKSLFGDSAIQVFYDISDFVEENIDKLVESNGSWIIWELTDKIPYKPTTKDKIIAQCEVKQITELSNREIEQWLLKKAKKYLLNISPQNVQYLASLHGNDLQLLQNELQKLFWYTDKGIREVTKQDIDLLTDPTKEGNIFSLMDSIGSRNTVAIAKACSEIYSKNMDEWQIFFMTIRHLRLLLQSKLGITVKAPPFVKQKLSNQASKWTVDEIVIALKRLSQEEYKVKIGKSQSLLPGYIELMLTEVCSSET
ncbi:hypothetical protein GW793_02660 [bacterium]|uniref:DNA-directed DNA polymerase n=2 Tax=Katanobacteria TaxID=422282 RepID=A0A2M7X3V4_UNCKA|nr:hypothetical protein [bacterium]PIP56256.1 MAG: hypothetical protein COX05_03920 [candidate division WWE3 bacterium CG22_combo_CG10-13_8_21_14_all_39_12]PJA40827.1 MAG: hypothetical protein CO179_01235 [candidate division WWE3 bacterium CG_4_9_14_3_um_filter_39_7]